MDELAITLASGDESLIDVCPQCRWVFIEFFDGEPVAIARELRQVLAGSDPPSLPDAPIRCPDCEVVADIVPFENGGPPLWRCGSCAGILATPATLRALASYEPPRTTLPDGFLDRVVRALSSGSRSD